MVDDSTGRTTMTKGVGTLIYSAPEILNGDSEYDTQMTDIYSYGILLWYRDFRLSDSHFELGSCFCKKSHILNHRWTNGLLVKSLSM